MARTVLLHAALLYAVVVWASAFPVAKACLLGIHPVALVGWRFSLAALCLLPFVIGARGLRRTFRQGAFLAALLVALYVPHTIGLGYTTASNSGFLTGAFILFVPFFMRYCDRQAPRPAHWAAVALALSGVWLVTGGLSGFNRGELLTVASTFVYTAHLFALSRCVRGGSEITLLAFHQFWLTGAACLAAAAAAGLPLRPSEAGVARSIAYLAIFPTLTAFFAQMIGQKHLPPLTVSLIFSLEPLAAAVFSWTLGGEAFRARAAGGGLLIVAAIAVAELAGRRGEAAARKGLGSRARTVLGPKEAAASPS